MALNTTITARNKVRNATNSTPSDISRLSPGRALLRNISCGRETQGDKTCSRNVSAGVTPTCRLRLAEPNRGEDSEVGVTDRSAIGRATVQVGPRSGDTVAYQHPWASKMGRMGGKPTVQKFSGVIPYRNCYISAFCSIRRHFCVPNIFKINWPKSEEK